MPSADEHQAVADHLSEALLSIERLDYNIPAEPELRELLDAKETIHELCLAHRKAQRGKERQEDNDD